MHWRFRLLQVLAVLSLQVPVADWLASKGASPVASQLEVDKWQEGGGLCPDPQQAPPLFMLYLSLLHSHYTHPRVLPMLNWMTKLSDQAGLGSFACFSVLVGRQTASSAAAQTFLKELKLPISMFMGQPLKALMHLLRSKAGQFQQVLDALRDYSQQSEISWTHRRPMDSRRCVLPSKTNLSARQRHC